MTAEPLFRMLPAVESWTADVHGVPEPKGSKTGIIIKGQVRLLEGANSKQRHRIERWQIQCETVFAFAMNHESPLYDEPVRCVLAFRLPLPEGDQLRTRHAVKPDLDKLCRCVMDSLTKAGVWVDDSRCCELQATKRYVASHEEPGVSVVLHPLGAVEAEDRALLKEQGRSFTRK